MSDLFLTPLGQPLAIACSECREAEPLDPYRSILGPNRTIGWRYTFEDGWQCPRCSTHPKKLPRRNATAELLSGVYHE